MADQRSGAHAPADPELRQRVFHDSFGEGIVLSAEGTGAKTRVQVNFDDAGIKWLVLGFTTLQAV